MAAFFAATFFAAGLASALTTIGFGAATITVEFYDFGKPVDATIPADADTIDLAALTGTR